MIVKVVMQNALFFILIFSASFSCGASTLVEDDTLIRPEFVLYFKKKYEHVDLAIDVHNSFRSEEKIKKSAHVDAKELPKPTPFV